MVIFSSPVVCCLKLNIPEINASETRLEEEDALVFGALTCGLVEFGAMKALKDVPLNMVVLRADIPKARCLEVMLTDGPSNSIF